MDISVPNFAREGDGKFPVMRRDDPLRWSEVESRTGRDHAHVHLTRSRSVWLGIIRLDETAFIYHAIERIFLGTLP